MKPWLLMLLLAPLAACKSLVPAPALGNEVDESVALAGWQSFLEEYVDEYGRIDFDRARDGATSLDRFVAWIAVNGPETSPDRYATRESRIVFYVNAYNALAVYNVLHGGVLPINRLRFFALRELSLDGDRISLYDLENEVIRPLGEERVHFFLNCMSTSCPRLTRTALREHELSSQLDAATREFLSSPVHVRFDPKFNEVSFNPILDWYAGDFVARAPSLIEYANRYRGEPIPLDARVRFHRYDWSLIDR